MNALMSKLLHNFRRIFTCFVAALHLAVPLATHELHLGCSHNEPASNGTGSTDAHASHLHSWSHTCHCSHHTSCADPQQKPSSDTPHDSSSCRICRAGFAVAVAEFDIQPVSKSGLVEWVEEQEIVIPEWAIPYRDLSRGPPA